MTSMKILVVTVLFVVLTEGQFMFPHFGGFPGYPPMFRKPLPVSQSPRMSGPIQSPSLFHPSLSPPYGFGVPFIPSLDIPEYPEPFVDVPTPFMEVSRPFLDVPRFRPRRYPDPLDPRDIERAFSGLSASSTITGNGGVIVITTNEDGKTQTFISPSRDGKFYRIPSPPFASGMPAFMMPDIPEMKLSQFEIPPINTNEMPLKFTKFHAKAVGSSFHMSSKNGEKPKIVSEVISFTNDNGKIDRKIMKYEH